MVLINITQIFSTKVCNVTIFNFLRQYYPGCNILNLFFLPWWILLDPIFEP